MKGVIDLI